MKTNKTTEISKRCDYLTGIDGRCPNHGDVTYFIKKFDKTRLLTRETEIDFYRQFNESAAIFVPTEQKQGTIEMVKTKILNKINNLVNEIIKNLA